MLLKNTQVFIYKLLKNFCFGLGFFSIGASIYLWISGDQYYQIFVLKLYREHASLFVGLWAPTAFLLSIIFDRFVDKLQKKRK